MATWKKTLPLALVVLLVSHASTEIDADSPNRAQPFKRGNVYTFGYDAQVMSGMLSGLPMIDESPQAQKAGTRIRAEASITFNDPADEQHGTLRIQDIYIGSLNRNVDNKDGVRSLQALEMFEAKPIGEEQKSSLSLPAEFRYEQGVVSQINFVGEDKSWSRNIKKAILNMIQLNLKKQVLKPVEYYLDGHEIVSQDEQQNQGLDLEAFTLPEETIEGDCLTAYSVSKDNQQEEMNVTKSIDFLRCNQMADVSFGYESIGSQIRCAECRMRQQTYWKSQKNQQGVDENERIAVEACLQNCDAQAIPNEVLDRSTIIRYNLAGNDNEYGIKKVQLVSEYSFKDPNCGWINKAQAEDPSQVLAVCPSLINVAVGELVYQQTSTAPEPVPSQDNLVTESLLYNNLYVLQQKRAFMYGDDKDAEENERNAFRKLANKVEIAENILREIIRETAFDSANGITTSAVLHTHQLIEILRKFSVDNINELYEKQQSSDSERSSEYKSDEDSLTTTPALTQQGQKAKEILDDCLAAAGTRNALFVLAKRIKSGKITKTKAILSMKSIMGAMHSPSDKQVGILLDLCKQFNDGEEPQTQALKQSCWLTVGALIGKLCEPKSNYTRVQLGLKNEKMCSSNKRKLYTEELVKLFDKSTTTYEKVLAIKTIGNAGLDLTVKHLEKIINNYGQSQQENSRAEPQQQQSALIRREAIDALRRLKRQMPDRLERVFLPVFQNTNEDESVRAAAFWQLIQINSVRVQKPILDQIAYTLANEKDDSKQLQSFVYTTLKAMAESKETTQQEIAQHLQTLMKSLESKHLKSSRYYSVPVYAPHQSSNPNFFFNFATFFSNGNLLPTTMSASIGAQSTSADATTSNGHFSSGNLRVYFAQKDLEQWYERFMQQYMANNEKSSLYENPLMEQISSKLSITKRRGTRDGSAYALMCVRVGDIDHFALMVNENGLPMTIKQLLNGERPSSTTFGTFKDSNTLRHTMNVAMALGDKSAKLPTSIGIQLKITHTTPLLASIRAKWNRKSATSKERFSLQPAIGIAHIHSSEMFLPIVTSGVERIQSTEMNLPIDVEFSMAKSEQESVVKMGFRLPRESKTYLLGGHTFPATFTKNWNRKTHSNEEAIVKTLYHESLVHLQKDYDHSISPFGMKLSVEGTWYIPHIDHQHSYAEMIKSFLISENHVHFYLEPEQKQSPSSDDVADIEFQISGKAFKTKSQTDLANSLKELAKFYDDWQDMEISQSESGQNLRDKLNAQLARIEKRNRVFQHWLTFKVKANGNPARKNQRQSAQLRVQADCEDTLSYCLLSSEIQRSPMTSNETSNWSLKAKSHLILPEQVASVEQIESGGNQRKFLKLVSQTDLEWGPQNQNHEKISVKVHGENWKTNEWVQKELYESHEDIEEEQKKAAFLNKYNVKVVYERETAEKWMHMGYNAFKTNNYWNLKVEGGEEKNIQPKQNQVEIQMIIDPITQQHVNVSARSPFDPTKTEFESIHLTRKTHPFALVREDDNNDWEHRPGSWSELVKSVGLLGRAECQADGRQIKTFDEVVFKAPLSKCYSVLAKDCSISPSTGHPSFVVLIKKANDQGNDDQQAKKLKVVTPRETIEVEQVSSSSALSVHINGQMVPYNSEALVKEYDSFSSVRFTNSKKSEVEIHTKDVTVRFDGRRAWVRLSALHRHTQCGLCGHFDGNPNDEFRSGNNQLDEEGSQLKEFHRSYSIQMDEDCTEQERKSFYEGQSNSDFKRFRTERIMSIKKARQQSDEREEEPPQKGRKREQKRDSSSSSSSSSEGDDDLSDRKIKPIKMTAIKEMSQKVCFSKKPVKQCPEGSVPVFDDQNEITKPNKDEGDEKTQFACLRRTSAEADHFTRTVRKLRKMSRNGQITEKWRRISNDLEEELTKFSAAFVDVVKTPVDCHVEDNY